MELEFNNPIYLWFLLSIPLIVFSHFTLLKRTKRKAIKFANFHALKRIAGQKLVTKNLTQLFLRAGALLCLILAISGTVLWYTGMSSENNIVIAIDASASMSAQDFSPTRFEAAKTAASQFIDNLDSGDIGLISFAGDTFIHLPLTSSKSRVKSEISALEIIPAGGTDIPGALITGTNLLEGSEKGKAIILLTDGSSTKGEFISDSVQKAVDYAKSKHVIVHTIGIGSTSGPIGYLPEYYNISAIYDEEALERIANETGGRYFYAASSLELSNAYSTIGGMSEEGLLSYDLSPGLLMIALILIFVEWGLSNTRFRKVP